MVLNIFHGTKERKSPGLRDIGGCILKNCALQLADIFCLIFQLSLKLHKVPCLWKDSIIVTVQSKTPKTLSDFRPVALSSLVIKTFVKNGEECTFGQYTG